MNQEIKIKKRSIYIFLAVVVIIGLIIFTAEQIAEVWDISDACGGDGHIGGEH